MGYMLRVRLSSFFAGAATASVAGFYILYRDYKLTHRSISHQVGGLIETFDDRYESLNRRIEALESLKGFGQAAATENSN